MANQFALQIALILTIYCSITLAIPWGTCEDTSAGLVPGLCQYCNSTEAHSLGNYSEACRLYPDYVNFQPRPDECVFEGGDQFIEGEDNPCCPYYSVGTRVLNLGSWSIDADTRFWNIPVRCTEAGSQAVCNPEGTINGQYCNQNGWCSFLSGTIVNKTAYRQYGDFENYTYCVYSFKVDDGQIGSDKFIKTVSAAGQQYIISYIEELAMDTVPTPSPNVITTSGPTLSPSVSGNTSKPTSKPTVSKDDETAIIIGSVIGGTAVLIIIILIAVCIIKKREHAESVSDGSDLNENEDLISDPQYD